MRFLKQIKIKVTICALGALSGVLFILKSVDDTDYCFSLRCFLRLGRWHRDVHGLDERSIPTIVDYLKGGTEQDGSWYKVGGVLDEKCASVVIHFIWFVQNKKYYQTKLLLTIVSPS